MGQTDQSMELDERDREVLRVLAAERRANPMLIREHTDLSKGDVNTVLNRLSRQSFVRQVTTGLYEVTEEGREAVFDDPDHRGGQWLGTLDGIKIRDPPADAEAGNEHSVVEFHGTEAMAATAVDDDAFAEKFAQLGGEIDLALKKSDS